MSSNARKAMLLPEPEVPLIMKNFGEFLDISLISGVVRLRTPFLDVVNNFLCRSGLA